MKLSVFLLVALLALSSAAQQEQNPTTEDDVHLNPALENIIPKIKVKRPLPAPPAHMNRIRTSSPTTVYGSTLEWQTSFGSAPPGAVRIYIRRFDYICKYECFAGFFNPQLGPFCYYPNAGKEYKGYPFQILVNKGNFERLEWKADSSGRVPENSVNTCAGEDIYVGKNKFGLGKVDVRNKMFFLPQRGKEYRYRNYEVLTINKNYATERMHNVKYDVSKAKFTEHPLQVLRQSSLTNHACSSVEKTAELSRTFQEEKRWDSSTSFTFGILTSITAKIPLVKSFSLEFSFETTFTFSSGSSLTESTTHSVSIKKEIPPNNSCSFSMMGRMNEAEIPFTATLSRTYKDGVTTSRSINGTFIGTNVGDIHSVVDRCEPLSNAAPCEKSFRGRR